MKKNSVLILILMILVSAFAIQGAAQENGERYKIVFVDESTTFEISMRVQGLVGALKARKELEVQAKTAEVENPTENPLKEEEISGVDLVIIVPRTVETGRVNQVWVITRPITTIPLEARAEAIERLEQLKGAIEKAFAGKVKPVGVNDDVIPAYFSTLFLREGILR